jgi:CHAD domain-containing protein
MADLLAASRVLEVEFMAFRLKIEKSLKAGIRKAARKQIEDAIGQLENDPSQAQEAVHEIRVHLKKLRAVVRLIRGALGREYARENVCFRDVARQLSGRRDAEAATGMLGKLCDWFRRQSDVDPADADELRAAAERIASWTAGIKSFDTISAGLEATYRRARRSMEIALDQRTPETLHEWRKQTKYHRYQVNLLEEAWPAALEPMSKVLEQLSDLLGDDHDLVVLREMLSGGESELGEEAELDVCLEAIDRRRAELFDELRPLGELSFAEKPKRLRQRIEKYWKIRRDAAR